MNASRRLSQCAVWLTLAAIAVPQLAADEQCVVLLHGLARGPGSMGAMQAALEEAGYQVANVDYPSRQHGIDELAKLAISDGVEACAGMTTHFVTHSLGGILVRYHLERAAIAGLGRVVMLGPPNQGSQVVDDYRNVPGFKAYNGPAGMQLGTDPDSVPANLGPANFELGVIAGTRSVNPILSMSLPNPDDGKVSAASTEVEGMADFIMLPTTHTFMMRSDAVIEQVLHFLRHGAFVHKASEHEIENGSKEQSKEQDASQ